MYIAVCVIVCVVGISAGISSQELSIKLNSQLEDRTSKHDTVPSSHTLTEKRDNTHTHTYFISLQPLR